MEIISTQYKIVYLWGEIREEYSGACCKVGTGCILYHSLYHYALIGYLILHIKRKPCINK